MQQLRMKKLKNYYSLILFFLLVSTQVKAQSVDVIIKENGNERQESIDLPVSMTYPLDSLLNDWKAKNYIDLGKDSVLLKSILFSVTPSTSTAFHVSRLSWKCPIMKSYANSSTCIPDVYVIKFLLC